MSDPLLDLIVQDGWLSLYVRNTFEIDISWFGILLAVGVGFALKYRKKGKRK
jgi:hypothetical protein